MTTIPANHFEATGTGVELLIDTNGLNGRPVVRLKVDEQNVAAELTPSVFGLEVEGIVRIVPDALEVAVRVSVPQVHVTDGEPVPFAAVAAVVTARSGFAPRLIEGVIHSYEFRPLAGTASVVTALAAVGADGDSAAAAC